MHPYLPPSKHFYAWFFLIAIFSPQISYPCNCKKFRLVLPLLATVFFLDGFFHLDLSPSNNSYRGSAAMYPVCQPTRQEPVVEGEIDGPREQL